MTPPRDPDEVEPTLLPNAPAKPTPVNSDTPQPAASDATVDVPSVTAPPAVDAGETLPSVAASASTREKTTETNAGVEVTLLPSSAGTERGTLADASASDASVTLPTPGGTVVSGTGSRGPLGSDTAPVSVTGGPEPQLGPSPSATGTRVGRFALQDLHATGGLGEVFKARDTELNREVAVKRIKSRYADDAGSRRRFLTEAELTARLDHPGVVPVFGLVNDVRGRPCYAMRFIRGETLKDEIERYHGLQKTEDRGQKTEKTEAPEAKSAEAKPAEAPAPALGEVPRSVAFRHLLTRFVATCQAIAYAHSRNIIHRDIKPANIMVGSFGETLVVDWGLAKSLDDGPDFDRIMKAAASVGFRHDPEATDLPTHATMAGTAVGTPAYMAPEQAAGELDKVGPRSDIYALGATLFVILTGKPPVVGKNTVEVLDYVRRGLYAPAAKVNPECPKPLDAIARKAMALQPEDRYATALELADDVERWLSDEPVSCYEYPFWERLARWARRHPARVATGVSLLIAGVLAAGGIAWAVHEGEKETRKERDNVVEEQKKTAVERDRAIEAEKQTAIERDRVAAQEKQTEEQRKQAVAARNVARDRYEKAVAAYNVLVNDIDKKLSDRAGMQDLRKRLLLNATDGLKQLIAGGGVSAGAADRTLVAAYRQMGEVYQLIGETAKARENFLKAVETAVLVQLAATPADRRAADRDLARSLDRLAGIHLQAGDTKAALDVIDNAIKLFEKLAEDKADAEAQKDLAAAKARRSTILMERGETSRALEDCNAALAARQRLSDATPADLERKRDLAASLDSLAGLQLRTGRTKDALESANKSLLARTEIAKQLTDRPEVTRELADAYARLGEVNFERGQMTGAAQAYRMGLDVLRKLAEEDEKSAGAKADLAAMYGRLGHVQLRTGEIDDAIANTKAGKELAAELQKSDPNSAKARRDLALAHERYGDAILAAGQIDEGIAEYAASEKILRPLRKEDGQSARARLELARGLERLGDGFVVKKDMAGAIVAFGESVEIRKEVAEKDKGSASAKRDYALGLYKLADAHCGAGKPNVGATFATPATEMLVALAAVDPDSAQAQRDLALAYAKWGQVLASSGHSTGALIVWLSSLDRCEKLAKVDAGNVQAKEDEAAAWERLANFYVALGYTDRALAASRTAVERWTAITNGVAKTKAGRRRLALAMLRCGDINTETKQLNTARDWYKKAATETDGAEGDPLLGPVAKLAAEQQVYLDAVEAGLKNPANVMQFPENVRGPALRTVATLEVRADRPVNASTAAVQFTKLATTPADKFAVARVFAGCAASSRGTDSAKDSYAADAVKYLKLAIDAGFRDTDALTAPEWDAVRKRAKEFAKVQAELEKLQEEQK